MHTRRAGQVMSVIVPPAPNVARLSDHLADDLRGIGEVPRLCGRGLLDLDLDVAGLDPRAEWDVVGGHHDVDRRRWTALTIAIPVSRLREQQDADEGDDREEHPHEQDQPVGSLQVNSPRGV
jgi:hypothetical protein